ncbi:outer membrane beta-barrel protein [Hymenobacter bucti]|uniref:Outer membrane beta-barrel protein n=1 Tax=Hymenobacter bucti TaxID=1844114 RepID=A0ABW4QZP2_9BACT
MLPHLLLTTGVLGTLLPLASSAQVAPASSRFYVGVGANLLSNLPFLDRGIVPSSFGPSLMVGLPFTPRWALQVGFSYHGKREMIANPNSAVEATVRTKYFLVPALLRYTVTEPANPVQFDLLGGATLVHAKGRTTFSPPSNNESTLSDTRFNLTLGPAVRAAISSHLDLTVNGLVSMRVDEVYNFSDRFFLNTSLGLNYKFG